MDLQGSMTMLGETTQVLSCWACYNGRQQLQPQHRAGLPFGPKTVAERLEAGQHWDECVTL